LDEREVEAFHMVERFNEYDTMRASAANVLKRIFRIKREL
jgi:hypothetical protein